MRHRCDTAVRWCEDRVRGPPRPSRRAGRVEYAAVSLLRSPCEGWVAFGSPCCCSLAHSAAISCDRRKSVIAQRLHRSVWTQRLDLCALMCVAAAAHIMCSRVMQRFLLHSHPNQLNTADLNEQPHRSTVLWDEIHVEKMKEDVCENQARSESDAQTMMGC